MVQRKRKMMAAVGAAAIAALSPASKAVTYTWLNNSSSWNTSFAWSPSTGFPGFTANDLALLSATPSFAPTLSASVNIARMRITSNAGGYNIGSASPAFSITMVSNGTTTGGALSSENTSGNNTVSAPLVFGAASTLTQSIYQASGGTLTLTGAISSTGSPTLLLSGAGLVNFVNPSNSYTGATNLNAGTLDIVNGALGSSGTVTFTGGTLQYANGANQDYSSRILASTSAINIDLNGNSIGYAGAIGSTNTAGFAASSTAVAGTLTLGGSNSYGGNTTVNTRVTLNIANANALSTGNLVFAGNGSFDNTTGGLLTLANNIVLSGGSGSFLGSSSLTVNGNLTLSGANRTLGVFGSTLTLAGNITDDNGSRLLTKAGGGTLTLSGSNSFGGGLTIGTSTGQTNLNSNYALGTTGLFTTGATDTIDNTSGVPVTIANNSGVVLNNITFGGTGALTFGTGSVQFSTNRTVQLNGTAPLTFNGPLANINGGVSFPTIAINGNTTASFAGATLSSATSGTSGYAGNAAINFTGTIANGSISGAGLSYTGTGTLILSGSNTFSGPTSVSGGTLRLANPFSLGNTSGVAASGATIDLFGQSIATATSVSSLGSLTNSAAATATYTGSISSSSGVIIGGLGDIVLSGPLGGTTGNPWVKNGNNRLIINDPGLVQHTSFNLAVNSGTVILADTQTVAIRTGLTINGGTVIIGAFDAGIFGNGQILDTTFATVNGGTFDVNSLGEAVATLTIGDGTQTPNITGTSGVLSSTNTIAAKSGNVTAILGGSNGLTKTTGGLVTLAASNTYAGTTSVQAGTLVAAAANALGTSSANITGGTLQLNNSLGAVNSAVTVGVDNGLAFNTGLGTATVASLAGTGSFALQDNALTPAAVALTAGSDNTSTAYSGRLSGAGSLTKTGTGTLTLSGTNTFTGATAVTAGALDVTGSVANSPTLTVNANAAAASLILDGASATSSTAALVGTGTSTLPTVTVNAGQTFGSLNTTGTTSFTAGNSTVGPIDGTGTLGVTGSTNLTATYVRHGGLSVGSGSTVTIAHDNQSATGGTPIGTSAVTTLAVNAAGTLDLTNNGIIVTDTTQFGAIQSSLATAYAAGWASPGITSSTAAAHTGDHGVGYALASAIGSTSFNGITFADAVIARYTLLGDTNLKGGVDLGDYTKVITNLGKTGTVWSDGNFDYSGTVGLGDYTKVILALGRTDATALNETTLNGTAGPSAKQVRAASSALTLKAAAAAIPAATATDVHLVVNTASGLVTLISAVSGSQAIITAYTVKSPSGSLVKFKNSGSKYLGSAFQNNPGVFYSSSNGNTYNNWTGIKNTSTIIGEGFGNNYIATNDTTWTNYTLSSGGYALGAMFKTLSAGGVQDLSFQWDDKALNTFTSVVDYVGGTVPEPTSVSLIAMGAVGLLGRRRRRVGK